MNRLPIASRKIIEKGKITENVKCLEKFKVVQRLNSSFHLRNSGHIEKKNPDSNFNQTPIEIQLKQQKIAKFHSQSIGSCLGHSTSEMKEKQSTSKSKFIAVKNRV